jgi:hypothetical protein
MADNTQEVAKKKQTVRGKRSPNYPNINLQKAISMISEFNEKYQRNAVPAPLAMEAMGYAITSGKAQSMLASLSYYDLIQVERGALETKKVNLTSLGVTILKNPNINARNQAIKKAALSPAIFKKLHAKFPDNVPQERLLSWELETAYQFNPKSIPDFITIFKQTMDFAKIYETGIIEEETGTSEEHNLDIEEDKNMEETQSPAVKLKLASEYSYTPPVDAKAERQVAMYPVGRDVSIRLIATGPITMKSIDKLIQMLEINKEDFATDDELAIIQQVKEKERQKKTE